MLRLRRSDRLVMLAVIGSLIPAWLALVGFDTLMALAAELDEIGEGEYSAGRAAFLMLYTLPRRAYQLFPAAALLGCVLGLGSLAASSELTALRAIGLSRLRICLGAAFVVAVLTAAMSLVAETIGPAGEQRAQALVLAAKTRDLAVARGPASGREKATPSSMRARVASKVEAPRPGWHWTEFASTNSPRTAN